MSYNFLNERKKQSNVNSMLDHMKSGSATGLFDPDKVVRTIAEIDKFIRPKLQGDLTIILAPTGAGKTTFCLNDAKAAIIGAIERGTNGAVAFFALEQGVDEIAEKWMKLTDSDPDLAARLYPYSNFTEKESFSLGDIKRKVLEIEEVTGYKIISIYIDHLHIVRHEGADYNPVLVEAKKMAKDLNMHIHIVSQTQKANQIIDVPVPRTGVYNCSQAEWQASYMISIFQPLSRVSSESGLDILGVQYCKIRYKNKKDGIKEGMNYLLSYDADTESLNPLSTDEKSKFMMWFEKVIELRQNEEKYKSFQFDLSHTVKGKDGKEVRISKIVGGENRDND